MGYYDQIADGSDKNEFRLWIEGIDAGFVTSSQDIRAGVTTTTNLEPWYVGLKREGMEFSQEADITQAKIKASSITLRIADIDGIATSVFAQDPSASTFLSADIGDLDTSIPVYDSSRFAVDQLVYIGTETWLVTAKPTATSLTVSRQWRGTYGQAFYVEAGERQRNPEVTDLPRVFEGRRARIYCKGEGDTGWTAVFYGILATEPRLNDLVEWEITIDPVTKILDQSIGPDETPRPPRGIYYPYNATFYMTITELAGSSWLTATINATATEPIKLTGFFETQEDFCDDLNSRISTVMVGFNGSLRVEPGDEGTIKVVHTTGASGYYLKVRVVCYHAPLPDSLQWFSDDGAWVITAAASETYTAEIDAAVPRGWYGHRGGGAFLAEPADAATYPSNRVYLGGAYETPASVFETLTFSGGDGADQIFAVDLVDTTSKYVEISQAVASVGLGFGYYETAGIKFGINFLSGYAGGDYGHVGDLMSSLQSLSSSYATIGYVPSITTSDWDTSRTITEANAATAGLGSLRNRRYYASKGVRLGELVSEECKLIGCYLSINSSGQIYARRVSALGTTDIPTAAIDATSTLMGTRPTQERNAYGIFNTVSVKTGYKWSKDDYDGPVLQIRNTADFGSARQSRDLSIEPKATGAITADDILSVFSSWFALFSKPYTIVTVQVPFTMFQVYIGDTVTLVSDKLPDYETGTRGWTTPKRGTVVGRRWDLNTGTGSLTLLMTGQIYAGYTPSMFITANTGGATVTTTTVTVNDNLLSPYNTTSMLPTGTDATDFFATGDRIIIKRFNSATLSPEYGTVTGSTATTISVTLDTSWTPGAYEWIISYDLSNEANLTADQRRFAYVAGEDRVIDFDGQPTTARLLA